MGRQQLLVGEHGQQQVVGEQALVVEGEEGRGLWEEREEKTHCGEAF